MLQTTLSTRFVPGSNLKGKVAGANWTFLLPELERGQILCLGAPSASAMATLRVRAKVVIMAASYDELAARDADEHNPEEQRLLQLEISGRDPFPLPDDSIDLVVLSSEFGLRLLRHNQAMQAEVRRVLRSEGLIYFETGLSRSRSAARRIRAVVGAGPGRHQVFRLTPLKGEIHTAIPADDLVTAAYFRRASLESRTVTQDSLKRAWRAVRGRRRRLSNGGGRAVSRRQLSRPPSGIKSIGQVLVNTAGRAENWLGRTDIAGRYGVLAGREAAAIDGSPPAYLQRLAATAQVEIASYSWGLVARGDYSSRKLLFFLTPPGATSPEMIVKMVRDSTFNARLQNEVAALRHLQIGALVSPATVPQVVFAGQHARLAMVAETVIEGMPFREACPMTAACPHGATAIEWLIGLATASAGQQRRRASDVATAWSQLLDRFRQIYPTFAKEARFLDAQITDLASSLDTMPLVVQHGDPGPWNMLVTPAGDVAVLDWEAAEIAGMPLWDLFYFLRSYALGAARSAGEGRRLAGFEQQFLSESPLTDMIVSATRDYCQSISLPGQFVEPLFYSCWMHRALKEATRLPAEAVAKGHYANLLRLCRQRRDAPVLRRLFDVAVGETSPETT